MIEDGILSYDTELSSTPESSPSEQYFNILKAFEELPIEDRRRALVNLGLISPSDNTDLEELMLSKLHEILEKRIGDIDTSINVLDSQISILSKTVNGENPGEGFLELIELLKEHKASLNELLLLSEHLLNLKNEVDKKITATLVNQELKNKADYNYVDSKVSSEITNYSKESEKNLTKLLLNYIAKDKVNRVKVCTPLEPNDAVNKSWVESRITAHDNNTDAHNIYSKIDARLSNYYPKSCVYPKRDVYSKIEIDNKINSLVERAMQLSLEAHIASIPHFDTWEIRNMITSYAAELLVSKSELDIKTELILDKIEKHLLTWKTSGPVLTTVGFVEDNTDLPEEVTMLEILDLIFYGSKISVSADNTTSIGGSINLTVCIHSGLSTEEINLYQNGVLTQTFDPEEFIEGCKTITVDSLFEKTTFKVEVKFVNGMILEKSVTVSVIAPAFVGLIPNFKFGSTLSFSLLEDLSKWDSINNKFILSNSKVIEHTYNFVDPKLRKPIVVVPAEYYELDQMTTPSLQFGADSFEKLLTNYEFDMGNNKKQIIPYYIYIYRLALSNMNLNVSFNFK